MVDFVEICNVCARKAIIEAANRITNSDKVCRSNSDLNFGVTFFGTQCIFVVVLHDIYVLCQESSDSSSVVRFDRILCDVPCR